MKAKELVYKKEYFQRFEQDIRAKYQDKTYTFDIELTDAGQTPDCKIGDFGNNIWFRTPHAIKNKKYTTVNRMKSAVERVLKEHGFTDLEWIGGG